MLAILLAILAGLVLLFWSLNDESGALSAISGGQAFYALGILALAILYLFAVSGDYRGRRREALRHAGIWIALAIGLVVAYSYRAELTSVAHRVAADDLEARLDSLLQIAPGTLG